MVKGNDRGTGIANENEYDVQERAYSGNSLIDRESINKDVSESYSGIYFSGAQCEVFIGPNQLDEVAEIEWTYNCDPVPIYGYASYHFNAAPYSRVIAMGSITINFKKSGYLYAYIKAYKENYDPRIHLGNTKNRFGDYIYGENALYTKTSETKATDTINDIVNYRDEIWGNNKQTTYSYLTAPIRPEYMAGPFRIKVKDVRVGYNKSDYEIHELINCFISRVMTVRRIDGSPVAEVYQWIGQTII